MKPSRNLLAAHHSEHIGAAFWLWNSSIERAMRNGQIAGREGLYRAAGIHPARRGKLSLFAASDKMTASQRVAQEGFPI
jgi:hypothetical protein